MVCGGDPSWVVTSCETDPRMQSGDRPFWILVASLLRFIQFASDGIWME